MAVVTTENGTSVDGLFKNRYIGRVEQVLSQDNEFQKRVPFDSSNKIGRYYMKAVQLRRPQGVTFASGSSANDAFALNGSVASTILDAYIDASSIVMQDRIGYTTMARAMSTEQAFAEVFDVTVEGLQMQARANIELMSLYGQSDLGTVESASTVSSKRQVVISKATWAAGIWPQLEGALVDVYADSTLASKVTATTYLQVVSVDIANRTITLDGTDYASVTANNVIVPYGTGTAGASWAKGVSKIIQTSGTLFGIDNSVYGNFKGNSYSSVNGVLTLGKINSAASLAWNRGTARKLTCFVSAWTWTDMNVDAAALRRYAESTKAGLDLGTTSITYYGPNGEIEIVPHRFVKAGEAFLLDLSSWSRVGSMDVTYSLPGLPENFILQLPSNAGFELRNFSDQAPFCWNPSAQTYISGIVNNSL